MTIGLAIIAAGARARTVVKTLLREGEGDLKICSVFDPSASAVEKALDTWDVVDALRAPSAEEAIAAPGVSWVLIFSPNACHKDHILAAFAAGKHVFTEKPLAITTDECREVHDAHSKTNLHFATGFVLRYAPLYRRAKELLASGKFGRLLSIAASENIAPEHGGYIMRNWRRHKALAGPHILEKCCHDLDLLNWYAESLPTKVASFAGLDFFVPENEPLMTTYGEKTFTLWPDPGAEGSPFTSDKDLHDTLVAILVYRSGLKVNFQATLSNALPERRMYFSCTEGTLNLETYAGLLTWKGLGDEDATTERFPPGLHGGGDAYIMRALFETMKDGTPPLCSGSEGLESAVVALAIDEAAGTESLVDLEDTWRALGR